MRVSFLNSKRIYHEREVVIGRGRVWVHLPVKGYPDFQGLLEQDFCLRLVVSLQKLTLKGGELPWSPSFAC